VKVAPAQHTTVPYWDKANRLSWNDSGRQMRSSSAATISGGTAIRSIRKQIPVNARNGCGTTSSSMPLRLAIRATESWCPGMSTAQNEPVASRCFPRSCRPRVAGTDRDRRLPDTTKPASVKFRNLNGRFSRQEGVFENRSRPSDVRSMEMLRTKRPLTCPDQPIRVGRARRAASANDRY
jgi:hypothetical protein